jgi:hypothetical protein
MHMPGRIRIAREYFMAAVFVAAVWLPLSDSIFKWDPAPEQDEKRLLASAPALPRAIRDIATLPGTFESYYNDNFGFRKSLLCLHGVAILARLAESPDVVVGGHGWLYYKPSLTDYADAEEVSVETLELWRRVAEARRDWLARRGIRYMVVIAPNKCSVYPEHLPAKVARRGKRSRLDRFLRHMHGRSTIEIVDLRPALLAAKEVGRAYDVTDTHWTGLGGLAAVTDFAARLRVTFPAVPPVDESSAIYSAKREAAGDLAKMLGLSGVLTETRLHVTLADGRDPVEDRSDPLYSDAAWAPYETRYVFKGKEEHLPRAIIFGDSFGEGIMFLMGRCFSRLVLIMTPRFDCAIVERENPDIVIDQFVERSLFKRFIPERNPPQLGT